MILVKDREVADHILNRARGNIRDYRYDMLSFRLLLCLRDTAWRLYADQYPNTTVTIMVRTAKADDDMTTAMPDVVNPQDDNIQTIVDLVTEVRESTGQNIVVADIFETDLASVIDLIKKSYEVMRPTEHPFSTFVLDKNHIEGPPLPAGFTLAELDPDAAYVHRFDEEQGQFPQAVSMNYLLRDYVRYLPSTGAFNKDGQLVGYLLTNDYGSVGKLYVSPHYRRQGIASHLIAHLSNRIVDEGFLHKCLINAYVWNEKSQSCFLKLGYKIIENSECYWFVVGDKTR